MKRWHSLIVIGLLLLAAAIRVSGVDKDARLHPDEALYADLSRTMMVEGDTNLLYRTTDKTPLTFFVTGSSIALLGETEFAVRLPGVFFSLIGLAGLYALGKQLAGKQAGLLALTLAVISPLESRYAPSVFQDIPMLAMLILALWQMTLKRPLSAGNFYGLSVMLKPTALWTLPVVAMFGILHITRARLLRFVPGVSIPIFAVILWDWGRPQSLFRTGLSNNNPGRFIRSDEIWPRLDIWLEHIRDIFTSSDIVVVLIIAMFLLAILRSKHSHRKWIELFTTFSLAYAALHWLIAFNTYDRYMLIIAPFLWLMIAIVVVDTTPLHWQIVLIAIFIIGGAPGTFDAAQVEFVPELHDIDGVAQRLRDDYQGRIIYDHWLNWELGWYGGGELWLVYFATPEDLADHLRGEEGERFFIAPTVDHARVWLHLLNARGIQTGLVMEQDGYVLYSIMP